MFVLKIVSLPLFTYLALFAAAQDIEQIEAKMFQIDAVHSTSIFRVHHFGAGMFYGRFNDVTGTIEVDDGTPSFNVSIDVNSVDTNNEKLDGHLKSPDFFNVVEFPSMTFKSTSAKKTGDEIYTVDGEISMHGVTKPITVQVANTGQATGRRGEMIGFETEFTIKRSEFGMTYGVENGALGDSVKIIVALEAGRR